MRTRMKKSMLIISIFILSQVPVATCIAQDAKSAELLLGSVYVLSGSYLSVNKETDIDAHLEMPFGFGLKVNIPGNKVRPIMGVDWTLPNKKRSFIGEDRVTQVIPYFGIGTEISSFGVYLGANITKWHYKGTPEGNISGKVGLSAGITYVSSRGLFSEKSWYGFTVHHTRGTFRTSFGGDNIEISGITILITGGISFELL